MISAIAIDDEPKAIDVIRHHVEKIEDINLIVCFNEPGEALKFLQQNPIDLIFLDINMPNMSGLDLLKKLNSCPAVIFTTAYASFALESYDFNAVDYLLKPFDFERFCTAIDKVKERRFIADQKKQYFFIKDGIKKMKIRYDDILFIKGSGNYLEINTTDKVYVPRMTFNEIIERLHGNNFIRVHLSYIINMDKIESIEHNHIFISSNKIPISNGFREQVQMRLDL